MLKTIAAKVGRDSDYPQRQNRIALLTRVLDGTLYDVLEYPFHEERNSAGEYIPLHSRRPSARYGLCKVVVDDSVSLLFDEGHFPQPQSDDEATARALSIIVKEARLNEVMIHAATRGGRAIGQLFFLAAAAGQEGAAAAGAGFELPLPVRAETLTRMVA